MSSTRSALILLCAAALTLGAGVVALELVFGQWLRGADWSRVERMNIVRDRQVTYDVRHVLGPEAKPVRYTRDRYGLRSRCATPAQMQVVTLGGSTTDQVYVDDEQTWQEMLRRDLNAAVPGLDLCVANAGVDGHTTFGHIEALRHWLPLIPELRPRVVLLYLGINDAAMRLQRGAMDEANGASGWLARLKRAIRNNSALYRAVSRLGRSAQDAPVFAAHRLIDPKEFQYTSDATTDGIEALVARNTGEFRARLGTLLQQIAALGAKPVCVSQPSIIYKQVDRRWVGIPKVFTYEGKAYNGLDYRTSLLALNRTMAQECTAAGGWFIDLEAKPFVASDFYDGVHMTPSGAARVGAYLASEFQRQGIAALVAKTDTR
jgi:lysophospholipase L1-like esterase